VDELVEMVRDCFPAAGLSGTDVLATWAGVRPLIREPGKSTRDTSRHDEVWIGPPGLVTVAGGKLTTYRPMARRILRKVAETRGSPLPGEEATARVPLPGMPDGPLEAFRERTGAALRGVGVPEPVIRRLDFLYGTELDLLLSYGREDARWLDPLAEGVPALRGEVRLAVERAMALTLADVMDRRLALLLFSKEGGRRGAPEAASIQRELLGWSGERVESELRAYEALVGEHGPRGAAGYDPSSSRPPSHPPRPPFIDTTPRPG
jgi:glycerol-3-phosphate dehydrogenase